MKKKPEFHQYFVEKSQYSAFCKGKPIAMGLSKRLLIFFLENLKLLTKTFEISLAKSLFF